MTAPTHITFAEFLYLLILTTTGVALNILNVTVIAISSLLPDIDTTASTVGRMLPFLSARLERRFGHRTLTHSVVCFIGIAILTIPVFILKSDVYVCFLAGYISHPLLDTMTVNGVKLFYPFSSVKCVFPFEVNNPHRYRVQTGSKMDKTLAIIFLIGCVPTFIIAYQGYERFIRATQQSIEAAVRDYNEFSKDRLVFANVNAYSMLTKQQLSGNVEVVGALNPHTLVFKGADGHLHTLGKGFQADYVVENILCVQGKPSHSFVQNVDMSNQLLSQITSYFNPTGENYFFGDLSTIDKVSLPENIKLFSPITGGGSTIKFNYATYNDIRDFNLEYVFVTKGILTIKTILEGNGLDSNKSNTHLSIPKLENYAQVSFILEPKEVATFVKQKGDTIREKEIIAKKNLAQFFQEQIDLNEEKIQMLQNQTVNSLSDIEQKIANAEQAASIDSIQYCHNRQLSDSGFISGSIAQLSELKWQKDKRILSQLTASKSVLTEKTSHEIRKLEVTNSQLKAKEKAAELQSEIRSTVAGVLIDIRQLQHNNKTQVTFIIKRLL